jgi:hypothetical protein
MSPARPPEGANSLSEGQGRRPKGAPVSVEPQYIEEDVPGGVPIKMWTRGVPVEDEAKRQLMNAARLPIVFKHIAAMPDVHFGIGATVGSVIPTRRAIIPAAVGVDIGCGMMAAKTTLRASDLPDNLGPLRSAIERAVPHGRAPRGHDTGAWSKVPASVDSAWAQLEPEFTELARDHPKLEKTNAHAEAGGVREGVSVDEEQSTADCSSLREPPELCEGVGMAYLRDKPRYGTPLAASRRRIGRRPLRPPECSQGDVHGQRALARCACVAAGLRGSRA